MKELKQEWADVGESHAYLTAEKGSIAQEAVSRILLEDIYQRRNEAITEIETAAAGLFSCLD